MSSFPDAPVRYCARLFTVNELELIRNLIAAEPKRNRQQLSRAVCQALGWLMPNGQIKHMSCKVALLRMYRDGLITLPPPQHSSAHAQNRLRLTSNSDPQFPISQPAGALGQLRIHPVQSKKDSSLWNELIERYHYLRYKPLPGAQIRYLIYSQSSQLLAALGWGASAWSVAPRDHWIGWNSQQRISNLHKIVNNSRFLILPWVSSKNLASRILSLVAQRLPQDWLLRYGFKPVLLETFVQQDRFHGTSYRAANWIHVGQTQGRGKLDRHNLHSLPIKDIFLFPLLKNFRQVLYSS